MLTALSRLGKVGSKVIEGSREDLLANLASLEPVLGELNRAGDDLPRSLELLLTYPFPDAAQARLYDGSGRVHIVCKQAGMPCNLLRFVIQKIIVVKLCP